MRIMTMTHEQPASPNQLPWVDEVTAETMEQRFGDYTQEDLYGVSTYIAEGVFNNNPSLVREVLGLMPDASEDPKAADLVTVAATMTHGLLLEASTMDEPISRVPENVYADMRDEMGADPTAFIVSARSNMVHQNGNLRDITFDMSACLSEGDARLTDSEGETIHRAALLTHEALYRATQITPPGTALVPVR